jgi:hypothetical protein
MSEGRAGLWLTPSQPSTRLPDGNANISASGMTKGEKDKAERLAAALRENLRRRKAQAREAQPKKDPTQAAKE